MGGSPLIGSLVVAAVLAVATGFGLWSRRRDGRLRPVTAQPSGAVSREAHRPATPIGPPPAPAAGDPATAGNESATGVAIAAGVAVAAGEAGPTGDPADGAAVAPGVLAGLGVEPGIPATLLQFSSAFCAPCRSTRRVLGEVSGLLTGVRHVEVDAESHLDAVRALDIWRTPTVLVVDARGRIVQRASGVPSKAQVVAALAPLIEGARP